MNCCGCFKQIICCPCAMLCGCDCGYIIQIEQGYAGVKTRVGRFVALLKPGMHVINDCLHEISLVNVKLQTMNLGRQMIPSRDTIQLTISSYLQYKITDPYQAKFAVQDIESTIQQIA